MKKIVITETQAKQLVNELFDSENIYDIRMTEDSDDGFNSNIRTLRYEFTTKDDVTYKILMTIWVNQKQARIDFNTVSENPDHTSGIELINTYDTVKVLNTLKAIIYQHRNEIDKVLISSTSDRVKFYEKVLNHLNVKSTTRDVNGQPYITAILNEQKGKTYKVYHGTNKKFKNFDFKNSTQGIVWFTDSIDSIKNQEHGGQGNQIIMTRYITINNPAGWEEYEKYGLQQLEDMGYDGVILPQKDKTDYFVFSPKNISAKEPI